MLAKQLTTISLYFVALLILAVAAVPFDSSTISEDNNSPTLNLGNCGKRYYQGKLPTDSRLYENPWLARFGYNRNGILTYLFQGALIHELFVVSTVFATKFTDFGQLTHVRLGEYNSSTDHDCQIINSKAGETCAPPTQDIAVDVIIVHPMYDAYEQVNNIALVQLSKPAKITPPSVLPICINQNVEPEAALLLVASWCGRRETGLSLIPKQYIMVHKNPRQCRELLTGYSLKQDDNMFCVVLDSRYKSPSDINLEPNLRGSTGAPVVTTQFDDRISLVGLLSYGPRYPAKFEEPYIVMSIAPYYDWMLSTIETAVARIGEEA
ncbi:serine protease easter-like [Anopheles aquasalis]|uniref:serine protease easter-like n=1 Tax=Anopheles aquasalis TaxID=42839 RepID=UPI00215A5B26|nr:serine protease easter-like [Anopheles aquasalis]